jgi:hypothetical protein
MSTSGTVGFVTALHASRVRASVVLSGGGGSLPLALLSVSGCSGTLVELLVPYATRATDRCLGFAPAKYVSGAAAADLALAALERGRGADPGGYRGFWDKNTLRFIAQIGLAPLDVMPPDVLLTTFFFFFCFA